MSDRRAFHCTKCNSDGSMETTEDKINCPHCGKVINLDAKGEKE